MKKLIFLTLFFISIFSLVSGIELSVSSYVDKTELTVNENLYLTIEINADKDIKAEPIIPQLTGLQIIGQSSSSSTSIEIINGKMSKNIKKSFTYTLSPLKVGEFIIPPILVKYHKKQYHTKSIKVTITASQANVSPKKSFRKGQYSNQGGGKEIFLEAQANKKSIYIGEPITINYKLYSNRNLVGLDAEKFPEFTGFLKEGTYQAKRISSTIEVINGIRYYSYRISEFTLFPTFSDRLTIEPMILVCAYEIPAKSFFDFGTTKRVKVQSNSINIDVKELPMDNKPADFSGAVGQFHISANLSNKQVQAGESLTLTVTISGKGNFKMFEPPTLPKLNNIGTFPPEISDILLESRKTEGKKIVKYILIPEEPGVYEIPEIQLSYFDPYKERYKTVTSLPIKFDVEKSEKPLGIHSYSRPQGIDINILDICFIKNISSIKNFSLVFEHFWFWILAIISSLSIMFAYIYRKEKDRLLQDRAYYRAKISNKKLQKDMNEVKSFLSSQQADTFFLVAEKALKNFIANRFNISAGSSKIQDIIDVLKVKNVDDKLIQDVKHFLIMTDQVRFSGIKYSKEEIKNKFTELNDIIHRLSKIKVRRNK